MNSEIFNDYSGENLNQTRKFWSIALYIAWIGGFLGICASLSNLITNGSVESITLILSLITLLASIPVYFERNRIMKKSGES